MTTRQSIQPRPVDRALVLGGSVGGLTAALALVRLAREVVVVERRDRPAGSIVPQGPLPHVLLAGGAQAMEQLSPGFTDALVRGGAVGGDRGPRPVHWWAHGEVRRQLPDTGVVAPLCSRALVESTLRARAGEASITWHQGSVSAVTVSEGRVRGVELADGSTVLADVVVDATGRAGRGAGWLDAAGIAVPPRERVVVDVVYTAVDVERRRGELDGALVTVVQNSATVPRIGVALPAEGGRWQIVLGGYFGNHPDLDRSSVLGFAGSLPDPAIARMLGAPWVSEPRRHRFPASERTRWDRVDLPAGYFVVGDAVASFNPLYGQGMSSAAQQALALRDALATRRPLARVTREHARSAARIADAPWRVATGSDFVYPETRGRKPRGTDLVNAYLERTIRAAAYDDVVNEALTRVQLLLAPPASLVSPALVARVLTRPTPRWAATPPGVNTPAV